MSVCGAHLLCLFDAVRHLHIIRIFERILIKALSLAATSVPWISTIEASAEAEAEVEYGAVLIEFAAAVRRLRDRAMRSPSGNFWRPGPDEATRQHDRVLRESADRYLAIFDTEVDAIVVADKFGIIQSFNRAAQSIFGYSAEEAIGRNVRSLMMEPDRSAARQLSGRLSRDRRTQDHRDRPRGDRAAKGWL